MDKPEHPARHVGRRESGTDKTLTVSRTLQPGDIARRRLFTQRLIGAPFADPVAVVRTLGAVQAQDYLGSKWAIAQRTRSATDAQVERVVSDGAIVRTHVLRPTWHFVAAEDIRWMLALTAPRVRAAMSYYDRLLEIDATVVKRSAAAVTKALTGGKHLTRAELGAVLERAKVGPAAGQRLGHLMMRAELDALICSGARRGKQFTYALLDERVPATKPKPRDDALAELARRYFTTRGPATANDFSWWSGLTVGDATRAVESIAETLEEQTVDRRRYWFTGKAPSPAAGRNVVHLLPNYDEFFIGLKDRSAIGARVRSEGVTDAADSFQAHLVAVGGQLVGGWKRVPAARAVELHVRLVVDVTSREMASIEAQARRYETFAEAPVRLVI